MPRKTPKKKPTTDQEIALVVRETEELVVDLEPIPKKIQSLRMTSDESYETLMEHARVVREMQRQVEAKQKWATEGLKESIKRVKSLFVPMITSCQSILGLVDGKQREFDRWQDEQYEKEQERLRKEAEDEQKRLERNAKRRAARRDDPREAEEILSSIPEVEAREAEKPEAPKVEGVSIAKVWDYEVVAPEDVPEFTMDGDDHVPLWDRNFFRANLLNAYKNARTDAGIENDETFQPIPGVRFFQKPVTRYGRL